MRVISGKYRGKKLACLEGEDIRPTLDRVKETMFNIIQFDVANSTVLDLFAGSGALGIEAISRGAKRVVFCDKFSQSLNVVRYNLESLKLEYMPEIVRGDYQIALNSLSRVKFDFIFVDPPFSQNLYEKVLMLIDNMGLLAENGKVICEHTTSCQMPDSVGQLNRCRVSQIGKTTLSFYAQKTEEMKQDSQEESV